MGDIGCPTPFMDLQYPRDSDIRIWNNRYQETHWHRWVRYAHHWFCVQATTDFEFIRK